jgi:hypothetical protein
LDDAAAGAALPFEAAAFAALGAALPFEAAALAAALLSFSTALQMCPRVI